jgi:hypothetical protein
MSDEQLLPQPLWDDARIQSATEWARYRGITKGTRIMLESMRTEYEVERAKLMQRIAELEAKLAEREAYEVVDTIETEWGYQLACVTEHPDGEITLQTTGYSIADPDQQFSIRMPKQYRLCRKQSEASDE